MVEIDTNFPRTSVSISSSISISTREELSSGGMYRGFIICLPHCAGFGDGLLGVVVGKIIWMFGRLWWC